MPTSKDTLKARLTRYRQIKISVVGTKSGRTVSVRSEDCLDRESSTKQSGGIQLRPVLEART
jgi:hypothetical protein